MSLSYLWEWVCYGFMDRVSKAFKFVKREWFLPPSVRALADMDEALPIGYGQTNSQPYTVRLMLEWLNAQPGDKVLDVGSGSGWTTGLLAQIVGPTGHVYAVEIVPELLEFGAHNCEQHGITNVSFHQAGQNYGLSEYAPFSRILVSASTNAIPVALIEQLKVGGKLVIPINSDIVELEKTADHDWSAQTHHGFVFVPLL